MVSDIKHVTCSSRFSVSAALGWVFLGVTIIPAVLGICSFVCHWHCTILPIDNIVLKKLWNDETWIDLKLRDCGNCMDNGIVFGFYRLIQRAM